MKFTSAAVAAACLLGAPENIYYSDAFSARPPHDQHWKEKRGFTLLAVFTVLLLGLALYAGQIRGSNLASGTTRGGAAASLMMSNEAVESGCYWCPLSCGAGDNCCHCKYNLPIGAECSSDNQCLSGSCETSCLYLCTK